MADNFYSLAQDANSHRANSLSPDRRHASASPSDHRQFLFTELSTIEGSCEITRKSVEGKEVKGKGSDEDLDIASAERRDQSNGQPLQPSRSPTGDIRKVQSHSVEDVTKQESPDRHHQRSSSGSEMHARNNNSVNASLSPAKGDASELTGQPETFRSQESVEVTITVSNETDVMTKESIQITSNQLGADTQLDSAVVVLNGKPEPEEEPAQLEEEDRHHNVKQLSSDGNEILSPKQELQGTTSKKPENMEWVGHSYYCSNT